MNKTKQWPFMHYYAGYEVRLLKEGNAVMLVEQGQEPRNVIIAQKHDDGLFVGENDYVAFCCYGVTWKMAPPSAGELDYPCKAAAWSEAVYRMTNEFGVDAADYPELTHEIYENLYENDYFIDGETCSQVAKDTAEDYFERNKEAMTEEQKAFWAKQF